MAVEYLIKISQIKATDLILKKEGNNSTIDPYVKIFFDGLKKYKTETISKSNNPVWKFEQTLTVQLQNKDELFSRKLDLECYDSCILGSDNLIGGITIDFYSLLTGPIYYRHVLRNKGVPNGHIEFNLEIQELKNTVLTFKNIKSTFYQPQSNSNEHYLYYYIDGSKNVKSYKSKRSSNYNWEDVDQILVQTGLRDLLEKPIVLNIVSYKSYNPENDSHEGQTHIKLSNMIIDINQVHDNKMISFAEAIMSRGMVVGIIEGEIYFQNVSYFAQMKEGIHTEVGVQGGVSYLPHSDNPITVPQQPQFTNNYISSNPVTTPQPTITSTSNITISSSTNSSVKSATPGIGLPDGWEMRSSPSNGQVYYVHHPTKTTHWNLPDSVKIQMGQSNSSSSPPNSKPVQKIPQQPTQMLQQPTQIPQQVQQNFPQQPTQMPQQPPMMYPGVVPQQPQVMGYPGVQQQAYGYPGVVQQPYYVQPTVAYTYQYGSSHHGHHHCH